MTMWRLAVGTGVIALLAALAQPAVAGAAFDSGDAAIPVDGATQLEVHTTADCVPAEARCHFTARANLATAGTPVPFPPDLWARQTVTVRSMTRDVWQEVEYSSPSWAPRESKGGNYDGVLSKMFRSLTNVEITNVYYGSGPLERFTVAGTSAPIEWSTGRPAMGADFVVCTHIQVVYAGVNLTSPSACSQTRF
jgi:hypothetical protein